MSQVKIYGLKENLANKKTLLAQVIHESIVGGLCFPKDKKYHRFIKTLFLQIEEKVGIVKRDVEICISESDPSNWGFSGMTGDEIQLAYEVKV